MSRSVEYAGDSKGYVPFDDLDRNSPEYWEAVARNCFNSVGQDESVQEATAAALIAISLRLKGR